MSNNLLIIEDNSFQWQGFSFDNLSQWCFGGWTMDPTLQLFHMIRNIMIMIEPYQIKLNIFAKFREEKEQHDSEEFP